MAENITTDNTTDSKLEPEIYKSFESYNDSSINNSEDKNKPQEFSPGVQELMERGANANLDRKKFLTLMGASLSMAGLNCIKEPVEKIVPYVNRPPEVQPGIASYYATTWATNETVTPMLVKTREGRPIKIEGLDKHPLTEGAMSANGFASIWDLYDPDRLRNPLLKSGKNLKDAEWEDALKKTITALRGNVTVLSRSSFSPSKDALLSEFLRKKKAKQVVYDPTGNLQEVAVGEKESYNSDIIPNYRFDKASLVLSLEVDFLGTWLSPEVFTKYFMKKRKPNKKMNRLIVAESLLSVTGGFADSRLPINSGAATTLALGIAKQLLASSSISGKTNLKKTLAPYTLNVVSEVTGIEIKTIKNIVKELKANKRKSLVVGGGPSSRDGKTGSLQNAVNLLNSLLDNEGKTIERNAGFKTKNNISSNKELLKLLKDMKAGKVDTLIVDECNPLYDLPITLNVKDALKNVKNVIVLTDHLTETAKLANIVLSTSHFLESWGDALSYGVYSITQPVIRPLFNTKSNGDIWLSLIESKKSFHEYVQKEAFKISSTKDFNQLLTDGFAVVQKNGAGKRVSFNSSALNNINIPSSRARYKLTLYETVQMGDGSGANNSYRQELPDPISKVTWENYLAVSPADAQANHWKTGDILKVKNANVELKIPAFVQPGLKKGTMGLALGYGHTSIGKIGNGLGVNAWNFALIEKKSYRFSGIAVQVEKVDSNYEIATTQKHHDMVGRNLSRSADIKDFIKDPKAGNHEHKFPGKGLYPGHEYNGYRWALDVDLNKCTGCSACVVSCYSENNIPVVGKDEILVGREMSWLRIDRYYKGDLENPEVVYQPVMCQHCENAPCENVCPVAATSHSSEGLNDIAYNRCIGTRYCANNCPYKVRRFNWFENWEGKIADPEQLALNPDVTVRSRGVIEKCSFCVQRINEKRQLAKVENREIQDGELRTACQQGCPSDAITFGNINDTKSEISKALKESRSYKILEQLNVEPMVSYQVRIKNSGKA